MTQAAEQDYQERVQTLGQQAAQLPRGWRVRIRGEANEDPETGMPVWSQTLTDADAQLIAYQGAQVLEMVMDIEQRTAYCLIAGIRVSA